MQVVKAYIGLGSNLGDKKTYINQALDLLTNNPGIKKLRAASLYKTAPMGYLEQDWFLNTVAEIETVLSPEELLALLKGVEDTLQRVRTIRWGPRTIDLDLLTYGDETINTRSLVIPHPRMTQRAFVMVPLAELNPTMIMFEGKTAELLAQELLINQDIIKIDNQKD